MDRKEAGGEAMSPAEPDETPYKVQSSKHGCGCRIGARDGASPAAWLGAALIGLALAVRRKRQRARLAKRRHTEHDEVGFGP